MSEKFLWNLLKKHKKGTTVVKNYRMPHNILSGAKNLTGDLLLQSQHSSICSSYHNGGFTYPWLTFSQSIKVALLSAYCILPMMSIIQRPVYILITTVWVSCFGGFRDVGSCSLFHTKEATIDFHEQSWELDLVSSLISACGGLGGGLLSFWQF